MIFFAGPTGNIGANLHVPECVTFDIPDCVIDTAVRSAVPECDCALGWMSAGQSVVVACAQDDSLSG